MATAAETKVISESLEKMIFRRNKEKKAKGDAEGDWYDRWLDSIQLMLDVTGEISETDLKRIKARLDYGTAMKKLELEYDKLDSMEDRAKLDAHTKILVARINQQKSYNEKTRVADAKLLEIIEDAVGKAGGKDIVMVAFDKWQKPTIGADKVEKPQISRDDPAWEVSFAKTMDLLNAKNQAPIFVYNADRTLDIDATNRNLNKRRLGGIDASELRRDMEVYNTKRAQSNTIQANLDADRQTAENHFKAAEAAFRKGDKAAFEQELQAAQEIFQRMDAKFELNNELISMEEAQNIIDSSHLRSEAHAEAKRAMKYAREQLGQDDQDSVRAGLARNVANTGFRAWAADHGFDRLGRVERDSDGNAIVSTYVEGGDDVAAILAWERQSLRRAGNYGFRGIDSGEIWRVELNDGTSVTGRRLKRHAADPMGAIRIVTADGARVITPEETTQAVILRKPKPTVRTIDRRAKRIYDREKGLYADLDEAAEFRAGLEDVEDLARNEDDEYIVDADGKYLRSDEVDAARARAPKNVVTMKEIDGKQYWIDGATANVYTVAPEGNGLIQVDDETKQAVIASDAVGVIQVRRATEGDVSTTKIGEDNWAIITSKDIGPLVSGEIQPESPDPGEEEIFSALQSELGSDAALGYGSTKDDPPTSVGDSSTGSDNGGIWTVDASDKGIPISDEAELGDITALEEAQLESVLGVKPGSEAGPTGAPKAVGRDDRPSRIIASLTNPEVSPEEKLRMANNYNEQFGREYAAAYNDLQGQDLGYELPPPTYVPPPPVEAAAEATTGATTETESTSYRREGDDGPEFLQITPVVETGSRPAPTPAPKTTPEASAAADAKAAQEAERTAVDAKNDADRIQIMENTVLRIRAEGKDDTNAYKDYINEYERQGLGPKGRPLLPFPSKGTTATKEDRSALTGQDPSTSLQKVPMGQGADPVTDVGAMSMTFDPKVFAPPTKVPEDKPSDSGLTDVGDINVPPAKPFAAKFMDLFRKNRKKKKEEGKPLDESGPGGEGIVDSQVPGPEGIYPVGTLGAGKDMSALTEMYNNLANKNKKKNKNDEDEDKDDGESK